MDLKYVAKNTNTYGGSPGSVQPDLCAICGSNDRMSYATVRSKKYWRCDFCGCLHESDETQGTSIVMNQLMNKPQWTDLDEETSVLDDGLCDRRAAIIITDANSPEAHNYKVTLRNGFVFELSHGLEMYEAKSMVLQVVEAFRLASRVQRLEEMVEYLCKNGSYNP
jgi:hypothetical protein